MWIVQAFYHRKRLVIEIVDRLAEEALFKAKNELKTIIGL